MAFTTPVVHDAVAVVALLVSFLTVLVVILSQTSGSSGAWATVDSQEVTAHFTFRSSESIPLARIAAVAVRRRLTWTRRSIFPESLSFISVFRKDVPGVVEIRARTSEADAFLFALARNAKRLGLSQIAPFAIPRRHYAHDLLPLVPALGVLLVIPFRVSWSSLALALGVFVIHSALAWRRFAKLAHDIAREKAPKEVQAWVKLLRTA